MRTRPRPGALAAVLLLTLAAPARAQYAEGGARTLGLGRSGVALGGEVWGHRNPAAWAGLGAPRGALQASQAFGLDELRLGTLAAAVPTGLGTFAVEARTYGFSQHRETRVGLGLGRSVALSPNRWFDLGLAVGYESVATEGFGSAGTVVVSLGAQGQITPTLRAGLTARNLQGVAADDEADLRRPLGAAPALAAGIAYTPSAKALVLVDAEQDVEGGLSVRAGVELRPVDALALRVGTSTAPVRFSAGAGFEVGPLRADLAVDVHESLGLTPAFGVEVSL